MSNINSNVIDICQYGFTEILQNVFDHSESQRVIYGIKRNAISVCLFVLDNGIGVFNKIQRYFNLNDPRHALLELSKGKLTSDPKRHSGEGIFFTSRMFDKFVILSEPLYYSRISTENSDWLLEVRDSEQAGTYITMEISPSSTRTAKSVFDIYSPDKDTYGFTRTHIPIELARYEGEQLVSRSQAKRLLARFERFSEVLLDFKGVTTIGQAFADEIFRVYHSEHPTVHIIRVNTTPDIDNMIKRVEANITSNADATTLLVPPS
jgi:anti-sigma regulatory factor (Ser/Thr protein kinase)